MKCDELKDYDYDPDFPFQSGGRFYDADEVDDAIAELKADNERLKAELESVQASMYCDVVDASMENLRLKRALWLARALRARDKAFEYHFKNNVEMCAKWDNVHLMLMAKAEEYK